MAIHNNRFQIMVHFRNLVIVPRVKQELSKVDQWIHQQFRRAKQWVQEADASGIQSLLDFTELLKTYSLRPAAG